MNITPNARIWRDAVARCMFHVGLESKSGQFCCWFSLEQDAITDLFGLGAYSRAGELEPGVPVPLKDVLNAPGNSTKKKVDGGGEGG